MVPGSVGAFGRQGLKRKGPILCVSTQGGQAKALVGLLTDPSDHTVVQMSHFLPLDHSHQGEQYPHQMGQLIQFGAICYFRSSDAECMCEKESECTCAL